MARWQSAFARHRKAMGYTQEDLADRLGVSRESVSRWDRLKNLPDPFTQPRLAAALKITPRELSELLDPTRQRTSAKATSSTRNCATRHDVVQNIQSAALTFQETDRRLGGAVLLPSVEQFLARDVAPHLLDAHGGTRAAEIFSAAASMTEIAGWMTHDSGHDIRAKAYFDRAYRLAVAAENNALAGNACASMSHLAIELGQHTDALRIASTGLSKVQQADGALRLAARLHTMRARTFALLGENQACAHSLDAAESILGRASGEVPAAWIANFDEGSLASEAALCSLTSLSTRKPSNVQLPPSGSVPATACAAERSVSSPWRRSSSEQVGSTRLPRSAPRSAR